MSAVGPRRLAHRGRVAARGLHVSAALLGEAAARRRVLALCGPGVSVHAALGGYVVLLPEPRWVRAEEAAGAPLVAQGDLLSTLPLTPGELEALPPGAGAGLRLVSAEGGALVLRDLAEAPTVDPARWLDLSALPATEVRSLGHPPAPPRRAPAPAPDLRAQVPGLGAAPPEVAALQAVLTGGPRPGGGPEPRQGWWSRLLGWLERRWQAGARAGGGRAGSPRRRVVAPRRPGLWARLTGWLGARLGRGAGASGPAGDAEAPPTEVGGPGLRAWLAERLTRLALRARLGPVFGARQARYLSALMDMFEDGALDDALRHAIPLASRRSAPATRPTLGVPDPRADLRLNLGPERSDGSAMVVHDDVYAELRARYRRALERLKAAGRVEEAVFVLADLLGEVEEAVSYLEAQGRLQLAAELAEARGLPAPQVVRLWVLAGDTARAVRLARQHQAFAVAVALLERGRAGGAEQLRLLWADALAERGDFGQAVEVVWPVAAARALAAGFIQRGLALGGPAAAGLLVRALELSPERYAELLPQAQAWLEDDDPGAPVIRQALGQALARTAASPLRARLAQATGRALMVDLATCALGDPALVRQLVVHAQDRLLASDAPALPRRPEGFFEARRLLNVELPPTDAGTLPIYDAVELPSGQLLAALGEAGVLLLTRDGRPVAHFKEPAERLVISELGHRALGIAARGDLSRVCRVDLVHRRASPWCDLPLTAFASRFDGWAWHVGLEGRLATLDATARGPEILDRNRDCNPIAITPGTRDLVVHHAGEDGTELWQLQLPGMVLRSRTPVALSPDEGEELILGRPGVDGALAYLVRRQSPAGEEVTAETTFMVGLLGPTSRRAHLDLPPVAAPRMVGMASAWPMVLTQESDAAVLRILSPQLGEAPTTRVRVCLAGTAWARARADGAGVVLSDARGRILRLNLLEGRVDRSVRVRP